MIGGGGGVGIQGVQLAAAMGMRPIVIDSGDAKRKLSLNMGAEEFIDFKDAKDVAAEVVRVADGVGAHGVLVTAYQSYPSTQLIPLALSSWESLLRYRTDYANRCCKLHRQSHWWSNHVYRTA